MKYCKNCGAPMSDDAYFCQNCGTKVSESTEVVSNQIVPFESHGIKERNLVLAIVLSIITCGIYSIYWMAKINDEALTLAKEKGSTGIVVVLLNLITCGIYGLFWSYKMGVCTDKIKGAQNGNSAILYLILALFGFSIVNMALTQDAVNNCVNGK